MSKTTQAFVIRDFTDAGTSTNYAAGAILPIEAGAYANFEAAGLVRQPTGDDIKAPAKAAADDSKGAKASA
jgi:hypothetical protein